MKPSKVYTFERSQVLVDLICDCGAREQVTCPDVRTAMNLDIECQRCGGDPSRVVAQQEETPQ